MPSAKPGYHALHQKLRGPLGLKTPIQIVPDTRWFFDHRPERKTIIIHAPPFHPDHHAPVFVHYLGHARLLQDGWPRMQATIEGDKEILDYLQELPQEQRERVPLYWASRSEDSFFDFFVWRFVSEQLGTDWLHRFLNASSASTTEQLLRFFGEKRSVGLDLHRYVYCLDWFAIPTGGELYGWYLRLFSTQDPRTLLEEVLSFTNVGLVYIVMPRGWDPQDRIDRLLRSHAHNTMEISKARIYQIRKLE